MIELDRRDTPDRVVNGAMTQRVLSAVALVAALSLAGCGSGGGVGGAVGAVGSVLNAGAGPDAPPPEPTTPVKTEARCPPVYVLPDTEVIRREAAGGGDDALQWQASITKTARECAPAGTGVTVRVGVSGRLVRGPKGTNSTLKLPLRVAVREGDGTAYNKVHTVTVSLDAPSKDWAYVDENVTISRPNVAQIFVGFEK